jgi:hypothetical protein
VQGKDAQFHGPEFVNMISDSARLSQPEPISGKIRRVGLRGCEGELRGAGEGPRASSGRTTLPNCADGLNPLMRDQAGARANRV